MWHPRKGWFYATFFSHETCRLLRWVRFWRVKNDTKWHKTTKSYTKLEGVVVNQAVFKGVIFRGLRVWCYVDPKGFVIDYRLLTIDYLVDRLRRRRDFTNWRIGKFGCLASGDKSGRESWGFFSFHLSGFAVKMVWWCWEEDFFQWKENLKNGDNTITVLSFLFYFTWQYRRP